jgi:isoleucyl-tRNA synthetase
MSKSRGGYIEPTQILQNQGADALRWNFYGNVDPWVGVRFTEESVRDVQRRFLLTLRNVYQFFTIYANIDGYDPLEVKDNPDVYSPLDKWILAKLNHTIKDVRFALDHYDVLSSAKALESFVDALSNWYVRRSRERFWRADKDTDKWAAYSVLFNCLVTLSKALAPFTPFISEEIYQNLGVGHLSDAKESVHLESYPGVEEKWLNDELEQEVALAMEIAKLGRSARKESKIRVRQPLSELIVVTDNPAHKTWAENQKDVILDELNIKALTFTGNQSDFVKYTITPNFSLLGPRFGRDMPLVKSAFGNLTDDQAKAIQTSLESGKTCTVDINGKSTTFTDEEVSVTMDSKEGYAAASGSTLAIVLKTELTGDLLSEGIAREIIHHVQGLRKTADLDYTAKIDAYIGTDNREVLDAVGQHEDYIRRETLANELKLESSDGLEHRADAKVDGVPVAFGLKVI